MRLVLGLLLSLVVVSGAQGPVVVEKPQLVQFSATPLYDDAGKLISMQVTAKFKVTMLGPDSRRKPFIRTVEFDLLQGGGQTAILGGELVEFKDISADIVGVAEFAWKQQNPEPLPVRRKALREN